MNETNDLNNLYQKLNTELEKLNNYNNQQEKFIESLKIIIGLLQPISKEYKSDFEALNSQILEFSNIINERMDENKINIQEGVKLIGESKNEFKTLIEDTRKELAESRKEFTKLVEETSTNFQKAGERDTTLINNVQKDLIKTQLAIENIQKDLSTIKERQELLREVKKSIKK